MALAEGGLSRALALAKTPLPLPPHSLGAEVRRTIASSVYRRRRSLRFSRQERLWGSRLKEVFFSRPKFLVLFNLPVLSFLKETLIGLDVSAAAFTLLRAADFAVNTRPAAAPLSMHNARQQLRQLLLRRLLSPRCPAFLVYCAPSHSAARSHPSPTLRRRMCVRLRVW